MYNNTFIFFGRPDGIGNRVEQLINIQEYCSDTKSLCIYVWRNSKFLANRCYTNYLSFDNIIIKESLDKDDKYEIKNASIFKRTLDRIVNYKFHFHIEILEPYDTIIHIRATDRLIESTPTDPTNSSDFSNTKELDDYIDKTIEYVNTNPKIQNYTIVSDDSYYLDYLKEKITKQYSNVSYNYTIHKDWLDYYYLTKASERIIMCSKFSSYSITASILANIQLVVFKNSMKSNLPRYNAKLEIINDLIY